MRIAFLPLVTGLSIAPLHADWLLSEYASPAPDSASAASIYGIHGWANDSSRVTTRAGSGYVELRADRIATTPGKPNSARFGLEHPLKPEGGAYNLPLLQSIDFEYRNDATISDYFAVQLLSPLYDSAALATGSVYEFALKGTSFLGVNSTWKAASATIADFATPSWWTSVPNEFPTMDQILQQVRGIRFVPRTKYANSGMEPTMTSLTLQVRKITLVGVGGERPKIPTGCDLPGFTLDASFDDARNALGGSWYRYADSDAPGGGASTSRQILTPGDSASSSIALETFLDRRVGTSVGWAGLATDLPDSARAFSKSGLSGVAFDLTAPSLPVASASILLHFDMTGIPDSSSFRVSIPGAQVRAEKQRFCAPPDILHQPQGTPATDTATFNPARLRRIRWSISLAPGADTATAGFRLSAVTLHNDFASGTKVAPGHASATPLRASWNGHAVLVRGAAQFDRFELRTLDGRRIGAFPATERLPVHLDAGTYLLVGTRDGKASTAAFVVTRG